MFRNFRAVSIVTVSQRTIKNFGHKREPVPLVTTIWHGFLTVTFIGLALKWDKFKKIFFGENENMVEDTTNPIGQL